MLVGAVHALLCDHRYSEQAVYRTCKNDSLVQKGSRPGL